ncbi:uncharacterized protein PAC_19038 [Phialocephala subalpina]|uniref:Uncharacterized protein n=1 Tax=Phialocephala subalpina TaxID=576137 RepID=A0A1L7XVV8_9HELO|nr:uncharacterized protein PAC_19038 [Phialocephala subalpina]
MSPSNNFSIYERLPPGDKAQRPKGLVSPARRSHSTPGTNVFLTGLLPSTFPRGPHPAPAHSPMLQKVNL